MVRAKKMKAKLRKQERMAKRRTSLWRCLLRLLKEGSMI